MSKPSKKTVIWLSVCAALLIAAVLAAVLFAVHSARHRVVSFRSVRVSDDLYAYWQARYRYEYLILYQSEGARDTDAFWDSYKDEATALTWRQDCADTTELLVSRILIGAYLFDQNGYSLTEGQRSAIETTLSDRLAVFSGDKKNYNAAAEKYGFTYQSAKKAAVYEAKANLLASYATASDEEVQAYYEEQYVRIRIILTSNADHADYIRGALTGETDAEARMSLFDGLASDTAYNRDPGSATYPAGYYFATASAFTESYQKELPEVVERVFSLEKAGDWTELACEDGTRFICRYTLPEQPAYENTANENFFSDLAHDAAAACFLKTLDGYRQEIVWNRAAVPALPAQGYDSDLYKFF